MLTTAPKAVSWHPAKLQQFIRGQITLGELEEVSAPEQRKIAELGQRFLTEGKLDNAQKIFEGLLALNPYHDYPYAGLAAVARQRGDLDTAERLYAKAVELAPGLEPLAAAHQEVLALKRMRTSSGSY
ncbi:MAG: tetratricopeptide repeat protein [Myxococcota bacterium]